MKAMALGCMRLSTERDRDEANSVAVLHAALDAGVTLLDTADAYGHDERERGHNERLIAAALATWSGDRGRVQVATKGGLTRPDGRWEADGRAKHLAAACERSRRALGVERIALYQLHAPDPRTPLATSVRALAALRRDGLVETIGLCNVTVGQIEEARRITGIESVQVELSAWRDEHFLSGVAEYCAANGLRLLAYRPLGGPARRHRVLKDPALVEVASRHDASPFEIALAWLADLSDLIVPLPGATRVETAQSIARASRVALTDDDRAVLDRRFPAGGAFRRAQSTARRAAGLAMGRGIDDSTPLGAGLPAPPDADSSTLRDPDASTALGTGPSTALGTDDSTALDAGPSAMLGTGPSTMLGTGPSTMLGTGAEVVLIMGLPGAGKSTLAEGLVAQGCHRINRDETGGTLRDLLPALDRALAAPAPRVVLDNTYVSRKSRAEVIRAASARGVPVRCVWLSTTVEDAQTNAASRLVARYGRLPADGELAALRRTDAAAMLPAVQFRYQRALEPPDASEGFARIDVVPFERRRDASLVNRALIVWCDGVLARSRSGRRVPADPDDVEVDAERASILRRHQDGGWRILGMSWQPEIAAGTQSPAGAEAVFRRMQELLDLQIEIEHCPHAAGPPACWCRKPLPGLGVLFVHRHRLDPSRCIYIGAGPHDRAFARRLGFDYREAGDFFGDEGLSMTNAE